MRECTCCHQVKDESEFYSSNLYQCKACRKAKSKEYRRLHCEEIRAKKKRYYQEHRQMIVANRAEYYRANTEKARACNKASTQKRREYWLEYLKTWRTDNYEEYREGIRKWNKEHPELIRAYGRAKDARKRGAAVCDFTVEQWEAVKKAYGGRCVYCGKKGRKLTQDHVIPLSRGGNHTMDNIVPACQSCNASKHARTPEEAGYTLQRKMAAVYQEA